MSNEQILKDKIPPHHEDAEKAVLGALFLDSDAIMAAAQLRPDDFYSLANGKIFKAICTISDKANVRPDEITVCDALQQSGELESVGGEAYVHSLTGVVPTSANIEYYVQLVLDCSLRREMIKITAQISADAYNISQDAEESLDKAQSLLFKLSDRKRKMDYRKVGVIVSQTIDIIEERKKKGDAYTGIPSGFDALDKMTSGFQKAEMIVIGARPSIGKTTFALNMAANIAIKYKHAVGFFTLEMSDIDLVTRMLAGEAHVDSRALQTGFVSTRDFSKIIEATGLIYPAPLFIVDMPYMKLQDVRTQARRLCQKEKVEIIFIDYLGLIASDVRYKDRYELVTEISRSLKGLARELQIPIIVLAQLGRTAEASRPNLASLRDSGAIEQDADVVMFLHRERKSTTKPGEGEPEAIETELIIAKQRKGPVDTINLEFRPRFTLFNEKAIEHH
ncbi:replicative DNA helicase [Spirochaetia bacterium]|nr:replicative DNA helicase [Spirochaetia bacterium]